MPETTSSYPIIRTKLFRPTEVSGFISCAPSLFFVLIINLLLSASLPAWAETTPLHPPKHGEDVSDGADRVTNRPYVFLGNDNLPPMTYMQDGKLIGIIVDIGDALKKQMNHSVRLDYMVWAEAQKLVLEGKADALLHINTSEERKKWFEFSDPLLESDFSIYINHTSTDIYRPDGLKGLKVGVQNKGFVYNLIKKEPLINLVAYPDILIGFRALKKGKIDAVVMDRHVGSFLLADHHISGIRITGEPFKRSASRIAVRKGDTALLAEINSALAAIKKNGTLAKIMTKWEPKEVVFQTKEESQRQKIILFVICAIAGIAIVVIFLFLAWNKTLKHVVNKRTSELWSINESLEAEIVERKIFEDALRESRDYLKSLTDSMGDAVLSIKMPERKIEWINDSFKIFGYEPKECLGKGTEFFYQDKNEYLAIGEKLAKAIAESKDIITTEANLRRKNGETFPAEATLTLVRENHEVVNMIAILRDVSARKEAEEKLLAYQKRLKALASQLTIAEEKERKRIAADLHDYVGQTLALINIQIASVRKKVLEPALVAKLDDISGTLQQTLQDTRHLMADLSSPAMNEIGLAAAISELLEELVEKRHNLKTEFIGDIDDLQSNLLKDNVRAILFRNVRELFTNVIKHAKANKVSVHIQEEDNQVKITLKDDGIGFDPDTVTLKDEQDGGFGLFSIKERMFDMNGTFQIVSEPGKGCEAILMVPVRTPHLESSTLNS